ncbi:BH3-interacting domain death agonist [Dromiciops gliroides]|uniref:BH3-interacting domain death agonist n=1 Tax=Dromiciops gliroides TaxID=33562 RepID=UPI001CC3C738|nr:BH3-interacting domain death agonist [Dromiciops gliroides]XP_043821961.1 BH3-interacting domain death agonist [Dromiciops gliroides]
MDQDNRPTSLLLYNFLQCSSNILFQTELEDLGSELTRVVLQGPHWEDEYELQTDGNRCYVEMPRPGEFESDSERQEEVIQCIARQLAQMGDKMENSIQPNLVNDLIQHFRNMHLVAEDKRRCLASTIEKVMETQTFPVGLEQEKAKLLLTMLLAKKVMTHAPSLFRSIFYITVDYINQNLFPYIRELTENAMD